MGDIARFADRGHFASWNGTAPIDASSGDQQRHRLSRAGNRRINRVLHIMAIVQLRNDTEGRAYYRRKLAAGKTSMEALRCVKRRLSDIVYRQMIKDAKAPETGPGGHPGTATGSSVAGSNPCTGALEKSLPGPAANDPTPIRPGSRSVLRAVPGAFDQSRPAARVKRSLLDTGEDRRILARRERRPS